MARCIILNHTEHVLCSDRSAICIKVGDFATRGGTDNLVLLIPLTNLTLLCSGGLFQYQGYEWFNFIKDFEVKIMKNKRLG